MCEARSTSTLPEYHGGSCSWPGFGWTASDRPPGTTRFLICEGVSQYSDEPGAAEGGEERLQVAFGEGWRRQGWRLEGRCGHGEKLIDRLLGSGPRHRHAPLEGGQELIGEVDARELLRGELGRVASHQLAVGAGDLFGGGRGRQSQDVVRSFQGHLSHKLRRRAGAWGRRHAGYGASSSAAAAGEDAHARASGFRRGGSPAGRPRGSRGPPPGSRARRGAAGPFSPDPGDGRRRR